MMLYLAAPNPVATCVGLVNSLRLRESIHQHEDIRTALSSCKLWCTSGLLKITEKYCFEAAVSH